MSINSLKVKQPIQAEDSVIVKQISTPTSPNSGYNKIYAKADGKFYRLESDGTETELGGSVVVPVNERIESVINNNQTSQADVTGLVVDSSEYVSFSVEYYVKRTATVFPYSDGSLDVSTTSNASDGSKISGTIQSTYAQADGKLLIGGFFLDYNGVTGRDMMLRLNSDGTLDTSFNTNAVDGAKFNGEILDINVQPDGKILVGGAFTDYGTANRNYLVRLNSDGTTDTAFCANAVDGAQFAFYIESIIIQSDGKILVGGWYNDYAGTVNRSRLIRLNSDGTLDTAFCNNASDGAKFQGVVYSLDVQSDGKILAGGNFPNYGGTTGRNYLVRLNSDGTLDTAFCNNASDSSKFNSTVHTLKVQSDGQILAGGGFTNYGTAGTDRLIRLNTNGTLDTGFTNPASGSSKFSAAVLSLDIEQSNQILVGGAFINYAGVTGRNYLVRLNSDGTTDTAFSTAAVDSAKFSNFIYTATSTPDGKVLVGGFFTNYAGTANRDKFIVLNAAPTSYIELSDAGSLGARYNPFTSTWAISYGGWVGNSYVSFYITNTGQVGYTSSNIEGLSYSGEMKCYFVSKIEV